MKMNPLFLVLIAGLVSCNTGVIETPPSTIAPPRDITSQDIAATQVTLVWEAVNGATGYRVSYGKTAAYGASVETSEPIAVITGLEKDTTYYFAVRTKDGEAVSSLPKQLVITTQGDTNVSDPTVTGGENPEKPASAEERAKPFDAATFAVEKAAWDALNIPDYRFVIRTFYGTPSYPATITVSSNTVANIEYGNEQEKSGFPYGETIDAMYASIAAEVAHTSGYAFWITYNATYHYPEYFCSSMIPPDGETIDGGASWFEISSFQLPF
jgi:hypothetical protein